MIWIKTGRRDEAKKGHYLLLPGAVYGTESKPSLKRMIQPTIIVARAFNGGLVSRAIITAQRG